MKSIGPVRRWSVIEGTACLVSKSSKCGTGICRGVVGKPGGVAIDLVHVPICAYVEDGLASGLPGCYSRGIEEAAERTSSCCHGRTRHGSWIIGVPGCIAVDVVHVLICGYIENRLTSRCAGCDSGWVKEAAKRTPGGRERRAGHERGIVLMPGRVAVQVVYMLVRTYVKNGLAVG